MKKFFLIILILLVSAGGVYLYVQKKNGGISNPTVQKIVDYFPFGKPSNEVNPPTDNNTSATSTSNNSGNNQVIVSYNNNPATLKLSLHQISEAPAISGGAFKKTGGSFVEYIDRATGNLYEVNTDSLSRKRITNKTIVKVRDASWLTADNFIVRYAHDSGDGIDSFSARLATAPLFATTSENLRDFVGTFLTPNVTDISLSPKKDHIFYLVTDDTTQGFISLPDGSKKVTLFQSPVSEWISSWPKDDTITLTTKGSANSAGYLFFVNTKSGVMNPILSGRAGFTTLTNPALTKILYSESTGIGFNTNIFDVKLGIPLPATVTTLPEKCVWSKKNTDIAYCAVPKTIPSNNYPDSWYQGIVSFNDSFYKVNVKSGTATFLIDPYEQLKSDVDGLKLFLDDNEDTLFFTNKKDSILWGLRLTSSS
ncbi:hypothetical protein KW783_01375 [Candidatus Parcubacteria bacterium]|nr:hypothetical protein [Candidatus Parcubacteria bacterium]